MSYQRCITPPPFNPSTGMFETSSQYRATTPPKIRYNVKAVTPPHQQINYNVKAMSPLRYTTRQDRAITPPQYVPVPVPVPIYTATSKTVQSDIVSIHEMRPRNTVPQQHIEFSTENLTKMEAGELKQEAEKVLAHVETLPTGSLFGGVYESVYGFIFRNVPWLFSK